MEKNIYIVQSITNWDYHELNDSFAVVGVADNMDRAKEMLKEEVETFFKCFNDTYHDYFDDYDIKPLNIEKDLISDTYYNYDNAELSTCCTIEIITKTLNK